jgi:hypothetical protein
MGKVGSGEYRHVHLDWSDDPPRFQRAELPPGDPDSRASANDEAERRVRAAMQAYLEDGWEPDGGLWEALTLESRERRVLLPIPGQAGPIWVEYVGAELRLRRSPARQGAALHGSVSERS